MVVPISDVSLQLTPVMFKRAKSPTKKIHTLATITTCWKSLPCSHKVEVLLKILLQTNKQKTQMGDDILVYF